MSEIYCTALVIFVDLGCYQGRRPLLSIMFLSKKKDRSLEEIFHHLILYHVKDNSLTIVIKDEVFQEEIGYMSDHGRIYMKYECNSCRCEVEYCNPRVGYSYLGTGMSMVWM